MLSSLRNSLNFRLISSVGISNINNLDGAVCQLLNQTMKFRGNVCIHKCAVTQLKHNIKPSVI